MSCVVSRLTFVSGKTQHAQIQEGGPPSVCKMKGVLVNLWGKGRGQREISKK